MTFALLFVLAFLIGLIIYHFKRSWWICVITPIVLFVVSVVFDSVDVREKYFSLMFGVPIIFFAALLAAYVYQMRLNIIEAASDEGNEGIETNEVEGHHD